MVSFIVATKPTDGHRVVGTVTHIVVQRGENYLGLFLHIKYITIGICSTSTFLNKLKCMLLTNCQIFYLCIYEVVNRNFCAHIIVELVAPISHKGNMT